MKVAWQRWLEPILLALLLPLVLLPIPFGLGLFLLLPAVWWWRRSLTGYWLPKTPVDKPLWGLLVMVVVSLYATFDLMWSLPKVAGLTYGIALFYGVTAFVMPLAGERLAAAEERVWWVVALLLAGGAAICGIALIGAEWESKLPLIGAVAARIPGPWLRQPGRDIGFNPNEVAGVLLWIVPVALALAVAGWRGGWRLAGYRIWPLLVVVALLESGILVLTQSRTALLGLLLGVGVMILWGVSRRWRLGLAGIGVIMGGGAAWWVWQTQAKDAVTVAGNQSLTTFVGRAELWERALYGIADFPLTGMGMNNFRVLVHQLYPIWLPPTEYDMAHAHNQWLQTGLDLGIPGLLAYVALWIGLGWMVWRIGERPLSPPFLALNQGILGALIASFVFGWVDAVALGARPGFVFWLLLGLLSGLYQLSERLRHTSEESVLGADSGEV